MKNTIFTLPEDSFVAGQSGNYRFNLYRPSGLPFNAYNCMGNFALLDYSNYSPTPLLSKQIEFDIGKEGLLNVAVIELDPAETSDLDGKYIYQISIKDSKDNTEILQGIFYIFNNINKAFIS